MHRWKVMFVLAVFMLTAGFVIRFLLLPEILRRHVNDIASALSGYDLRTNKITISLLAGSFDLHDVTLTKHDGTTEFQATRIHIALDVDALKAGQWFSRIGIHDAILFHSIESIQNSDPSDLPTYLQKIAILPVNEFSVAKASLYFKNTRESDPALSITEIGLRIRNLQNVMVGTRRLPAVGRATGRIEDANLYIDLDANAQAAHPSFNISARIKELNLSDVQQYLNDVGIRDVPQGLLSIYTEAGTMQNRVIGYVKQELEGVVSVSSRDLVRFPGKPMIRALDEVYFRRDLPYEHTSVWTAIGRTLHSAFIQSVSSLTNEHTGPPRARKSIPRTKPKKTISLVSVSMTQAYTIRSG